MKEVKGQVWVETVIYTLIALVMIGLVLSVAKPKIEKFQDKAVIETSIEIIEQIDLLIKEVEYYKAGNQRLMGIDLKKGTLKIDGINDQLIFEMESREQYTEFGTNYTEKGLLITSEKKGELNTIDIIKDYSARYNITSQQKDDIKTLSKSSSQYELVISNKGEDSDGRTKINFEIN